MCRIEKKSDRVNNTKTVLKILLEVFHRVFFILGHMLFNLFIHDPFYFLTTVQSTVLKIITPYWLLWKQFQN